MKNKNLCLNIISLSFYLVLLIFLASYIGVIIQTIWFNESDNQLAVGLASIILIVVMFYLVIIAAIVLISFIIKLIQIFTKKMSLSYPCLVFDVIYLISLIILSILALINIENYVTTIIFLLFAIIFNIISLISNSLIIKRYKKEKVNCLLN